MRKRARWLLAAWFLLSLGIGLSLGLAIGWVFWPRRPAYTDLPHLRQMYQEDYILMVSIAYAQDGDLQRAQGRLSYFGDSRAPQLVAKAAHKAIDQGASLVVRRYLSRLAHALGASSTAIIAYVATPVPTATPLPSPTLLQPPTARPTEPPTAQPTDTPMRYVRTPTPTTFAGTPGRETPTALTVEATQTQPARQTATPTLVKEIDYRLAELKQVCGKNYAAGHILIQVQDSKGRGISGVRLKVSWAGGEDSCLTGLHPDKDPGYVDYQMTPGVTYAVSLADSTSDVATNLVFLPPKKECAEGTRPGSWEVIFQRRN